MTVGSLTLRRYKRGAASARAFFRETSRLCARPSQSRQNLRRPEGPRWLSAPIAVVLISLADELVAERRKSELDGRMGARVGSRPIRCAGDDRNRAVTKTGFDTDPTIENLRVDLFLLLPGARRWRAVERVSRARVNRSRTAKVTPRPWSECPVLGTRIRVIMCRFVP